MRVAAEKPSRLMNPGDESCEQSYFEEKNLVLDCNTLAYRKGKEKRKTKKIRKKGQKKTI